MRDAVVIMRQFETHLTLHGKRLLLKQHSLKVFKLDRREDVYETFQSAIIVRVIRRKNQGTSHAGSATQ
jgi:hypothetical protein